MDDISNSILETIKKLIGIDKDYGVFDLDLITAINSSFMILNQLGVGPARPFSIRNSSATWSDFFQDDETFELAKTYIYLRTKLLFDPPTSGVLHEAVERQISEFEWRMKVQAEYNGTTIQPESGDHTTLINRDAPDQHPIEAITDLKRKLDAIPEIMSAEDLRQLLQN